MITIESIQLDPLYCTILETHLAKDFRYKFQLKPRLSSFHPLICHSVQIVETVAPGLTVLVELLFVRSS
jgi:hypothetical protein